MESDRIQETVTEILKSADLDAVTEQQVRELAAAKLRLDLSDLPHKILVRRIVEDFLLHNPAAAGGGGVADSCRVICKLSQKREVAVRSSGGKKSVIIREFFEKDGKMIMPKFISLSADQWSTFRKSIPDIEEAITKAESRLRHQVEKRQANADKSENLCQSNGFRQASAEPMLKIDTRHNLGIMDKGKQVGNGSSVSSTSHHKVVPIDIVRFDGKNYQQWVDQIESYLTHLNVRYVLSDPCPSAVGIADWEIPRTLSAIEKWMDDDSICRQTIINTLCDNLYSHYSKKTGSASSLWEELKVTYLYEEYGAKVSLVKKYIEFEIVEEKPILEQVQELHLIADALVAAGMYVEEKFHVGVIISKLPPSWKPFSIDLMKEDYLPVWMLMNELKAAEEYRSKENKLEGYRPRVASPTFQSGRKPGPQRVPMKRPGVHTANREMDHERKVRFCDICKKKGHLPDQCWFRNANSKDNTVEKDNVTVSDNAVVAVKDEPAEQINT